MRDLSERSDGCIVCCLSAKVLAPRRTAGKGWRVATKLIQLEDGLLVEAEVPEDQAEPISGGAVDRVDATLDVLEPLLIKACKPITAAWQQLSNEVHLDYAQIALGVNFTGEGSVYIAKATAGANLTITLVLKPNPMDNRKGNLP